MDEEKQKRIIKNVLIVVLILFALFVVLRVIFGLEILFSGIENYNKNYYIEEYGGDLDSNLSIFPNDTSNLSDAIFYSSFKTNLFDSDGYIILKSKYSKERFDKEIERLSKLNVTISDCRGDSYTNYIKYDDKSYEFPAYIAIDGFANKYEYALINNDDLEIVYIYLSHPNTYNSKYNKYLKKEKSEYLKADTIDMYSMYNHSFDNGETFMEYGDCP